ncbi:hypothetical protein GQ55_9G225900 [Panicum hallii var. hallii]|uniref:Uncharacterized protein n=1 Tax=Panicum hallii var. hallii TaxID=1504633 RepID=A0A2T7C637_9POAL|nr:hypothetical protein GQ55_9G225900 [Panicum hallii var. hallii]
MLQPLTLRIQSTKPSTKPSPKAWSIWKHRNCCVFDGCLPRPQLVLQEVTEQASLWVLAGAKALGVLLG